MDEGESVITMLDPGDYRAHLLLAFENGKVARIEMSAYETKTNRKKLVNAYSDKSPLRAVLVLTEEADLVCRSSDGRVLVFNSSLLQPKSSRSTQGVGVLAAKARRTLTELSFLADSPLENLARYRVRSLPAAGALLRAEDVGQEQLSLLDGE